jgi:hypothetical protein
MPTLVPWVLVTYGTTLAVTGSRIAEPCRRWLSTHWAWGGKLVGCPMCVGFWVGLASWFALPRLCPVQGAAWYLAAPANGFAGLAACWTCHVVLKRLGAEEL